jgi:hypothetical protein
MEYKRVSETETNEVVKSSVGGFRPEEVVVVPAGNVTYRVGGTCENITTFLSRHGSSLGVLVPTPELAILQEVIYDYILGALIPLGIFMNVVSIIVLSKDHPTKRGSVLLLQVLCLADSFYLLMNFLTWVLPSWLLHTSDVDLNCFSPYGYLAARVDGDKYYTRVLEASALIAIWLVVILTMDRFAVIYFPLKSIHICTVKVTVIQVIILMCYVIIWTIISEVLDRQVEVGFMLTASFILNAPVPATIVLILNIGIARSLHLSKTKRKTMSHRGSEALDEAAVTARLFAVALTFLICEIPILLYAIFKEALGDSNITMIFDMVSALFQNVNSSVNFMLYFLTGSRFRANLLRLVMCTPPQKYIHKNTLTHVNSSAGNATVSGNESPPPVTL